MEEENEVNPKYSTSRIGNDIATMSDSQFSASLDALLDLNAAARTSPSLDSVYQAESVAMPSLVSSNSSNSSTPHESPVIRTTPSSNSSVSSATATSVDFPVPQLFGKAVTLSMPTTTAASSSALTEDGSSQRGGRKRARGEVAVSEDEGEKEKRRQDRNVREQQRSRKVTEQIVHLRTVLEDAKLQFKPDKFTTLSTAVDYVKTLQEKSVTLDDEHKRLLDTITKTTEVINGLYVPVKSEEASNENDDAKEVEDETLVFIRGLDYKAIFQCCPFAYAITSVDGRFLDCSSDFEQLVGYTHDELIPSEDTKPVSPDSNGESGKISHSKNLSLFNILKEDDMQPVFSAMSEMLRRVLPGEIMDDFWTGFAHLNRFPEKRVNIKICLVRSRSEKRPRFFNITFVPEQ